MLKRNFKVFSVLFVFVILLVSLTSVSAATRENTLSSELSQKLVSGTLGSALDGKLILQKSSGTVYFVWKNGQKCAIPNPTTYNNLFKNWDTLISLSDYQISLLPTGEAISDGALLIKGDKSATVYLNTNGRKYGITSPTAFNYCNFNWDTIKTFPQIVVDSIPSGEYISYGE